MPFLAQSISYFHHKMIIKNITAILVGAIVFFGKTNARSLNGFEEVNQNDELGGLEAKGMLERSVEVEGMLERSVEVEGMLKRSVEAEGMLKRSVEAEGMLESLLEARLGVARCRAECGGAGLRRMEQYQACWDMCALLGEFTDNTFIL